MNQIICQLGITRSGEELAEIIAQAEARNVKILPLPMFHYRSAEFELTSAELSRIDWLCFTSARGVERFFEALAKQSQSVSSHTKFAVVGAKTAAALLAHGFSADIQPHTTISEALFEELLVLLNQADGEECQVVYVGAELVRFDPAPRFVGSNVKYSRLIAYRAEKFEAPEGIVENFSPDDSILFTSPKAAERYAELYGAPKAKVIAIGQITAEEIVTLGWRITETLSEPDLQLALESCLQTNSQCPS